MPTYDYECPKGHRFEVFQKMTDEPVAACPECGADAKRQISGGAGFLFKGEGFYITDYRSDDYRKKASADKGESKGESPSSGASGSSDGGSAAAGSDSGGSSPGSSGGTKGSSGGTSSDA
jgi:putative FmdB family regulatory protein